MKVALAAILVVAMALLLFTRLVAPPHQLTILDRFWPGDSATTQLADGEIFDKKHGLKLDVWGPAKRDGRKPVLVFFYGGGWANGERDHYAFAARAYAAKGFVVVVPDYRKVPNVRFPAFNDDGAAAVRWVKDNVSRFGGDPSRMVFAGHSAGAYIAMMLTLDRHYLQDAGVDPALVRGTVGLSGPYDFYPFDSRRSIDAMNKWPWPMETQPINYIRKDAPPILVVTGTEDDTVKPRNAIILSRELNKLGAPVKFQAYEGLGHEDVVMALSLPFRNKAPVLRDSAEFLMKAATTKE